MKKLSLSQQKEALTNSLKSYKFDDNYFVQVADKRIGKKFAIATNTEFGGLQIHSNYMSYDEFNAYLFGIYHAKTNKYIINL